ncbi:G1 family glutamic endopeptidase [Clostridium sp. cel8]|uniref:G1 family glutamic endopeptidase n=1 Tax=Clostridium sp. cel8 TaxID=2663123 RepID=UPI00325FCD0E
MYTSVSGSWTVPSISSSNPNASAAQWIGLGGYSSSDLLQMGTIEKLQNGQTVAEVFWEQLPDSAESIMTIPVNSTISVTISKESSLVWNLTFTVTTPNGTTETKTITKELTSSYENGIGTSAEWINEDPSNQYSKLFPLGNTGTVKFQSAKVNGNSIDDSSNVVHPIAMEYSNGSIAIYPSSLGADGESFTTTTNTNPNTNFNGYSRRIRRIINHIGNFQFGNTVSIKISAAWKY